MPEESNIIMDVPGENEHVYNVLFGSGETSESEWSFLPRTIQNQGAKASTRMACSRYGMAHAVNAQNEAVAVVDGQRFYEVSGEGMWENYLKVNAEALNEGATLQSALTQFVDVGYITGYSRLNSVDEMKHSLLAHRPIYTGSQNGDWMSVSQDKLYKLRTDGRIVGHIFCIVGFNNSGWIAVNSYGSADGVFYIPYELTSTLFSCYSISDSRDAQVFASNAIK